MNQPINATTSQIAGGRGYAIHHEECWKNEDGTKKFPPMRSGKQPKLNSTIKCDCGKQVKITENTSIWD